MSSNTIKKDIRTLGYVLKRTNYGEADRILNLITPQGKISAIAKGVRKEKVARKRAGVMFGIGLLGIFLTRFFIEIIKKDQEAFEADMLLNMGQLLSLPFIAMAIYVLWRAAQGSFPIGLPATKQHNTNKSKTKRK